MIDIDKLVGVNVRKGVIEPDRKHFESVTQLKPVILYHKEDGTKDDKPSFSLISVHPAIPCAGAISEISLDMLNEAMSEVGYTVLKKEKVNYEKTSVIIGNHIYGCNIKQLIDEGYISEKIPWHTLNNVRWVYYCNENGIETTISESNEKIESYNTTWLEINCFGYNEKGDKCNCVKRIKASSILTL